MNNKKSITKGANVLSTTKNSKENTKHKTQEELIQLGAVELLAIISNIFQVEITPSQVSQAAHKFVESLTDTNYHFPLQSVDLLLSEERRNIPSGNMFQTGKQSSSKKIVFLVLVKKMLSLKLLPPSKL
jgi:hypothetical protein